MLREWNIPFSHYVAAHPSIKLLIVDDIVLPTTPAYFSVGKSEKEKSLSNCLCFPFGNLNPRQDALIEKLLLITDKSQLTDALMKEVFGVMCPYPYPGQSEFGISKDQLAAVILGDPRSHAYKTVRPISLHPGLTFLVNILSAPELKANQVHLLFTSNAPENIASLFDAEKIRQESEALRRAHGDEIDVSELEKFAACMTELQSDSVFYSRGESMRVGLADHLKKQVAPVDPIAMLKDNSLGAGLVLAKESTVFPAWNLLDKIAISACAYEGVVRSSHGKIFELHYHDFSSEDKIKTLAEIIRAAWEMGSKIIINFRDDAYSQKEFQRKIRAVYAKSDNPHRGKAVGFLSRLDAMTVSLDDPRFTFLPETKALRPATVPTFFVQKKRSHRADAALPIKKLQLTGEFALCTDGRGAINTFEVFSELSKKVGVNTLAVSSLPASLEVPVLSTSGDYTADLALTAEGFLSGSVLPILEVDRNSQSYPPQLCYQSLQQHPLEAVELNAFKPDVMRYGRTYLLQFHRSIEVGGAVYCGVAIKVQKQGETPDKLHRELSLQSSLMQDPHLRSIFPRSLGKHSDVGTFITAEFAQKACSSFAVPKGYYDYLSEINDKETFIDSACRAAHDLGYLLKKYGLVFPNLISLFHDKDRPYTLLPDSLGAINVGYGGMPGDIPRIIGQSLYENIGQSGLRDLGDLESIQNYDLEKEGEKLSAPESLKVAHFISLYLMVFTLLIGNRSRMLARDPNDFEPWGENDVIFSKVMQSLFQGLGITLTPEELSYLDPSQVRETTKMQPGEKFNRQMYFCFTEFKSKILPQKRYFNVHHAGGVQPNNIRFEDPNIQKHQHTLHTFFGTQKATFYHKAGDRFSGSPSFSYTETADFGERGQLGTHSGINPLVTAGKYSLRAGQLAVVRLYEVPNVEYADDAREADSSLPKPPQRGQ